jgi:hypothetical protein
MSISVEFIFVLILAAIVLWMDGKATLLVIRDSLSDPRQRLIQLLMVWLLPILGAIIVFSVHRPAEKHPGHYKELPDPGDDFGFSRLDGRRRSNEGADDD